jgi:hypothetical protein
MPARKSLEPQRVVDGWNWYELIYQFSYYKTQLRQKIKPIESYDRVSRIVIAVVIRDLLVQFAGLCHYGSRTPSRRWSSGSCSVTPDIYEGPLYPFARLPYAPHIVSLLVGGIGLFLLQALLLRDLAHVGKMAFEAAEIARWPLRQRLPISVNSSQIVRFGSSWRIHKTQRQDRQARHLQ